MTIPIHTTVAIVAFIAKHERFTRKELTIGSGVTRNAVDRIVTALRKEKAIHIDEWLDDSRGRQSIAVFTLGPGTDARKRAKMTGKARTAAYVARKKAMAVATLNNAMQRMAQPKDEDACAT